MAALPDPPLVSVEEYLATSYPDGDREYLDGMVVERNLGTPGHSTLQKILIGHLLKFERPLQLTLFPECRLRVTETRYRVPDVLVMVRPFRQTDRVLLDAPLLIVEVLSPDDSVRAALRRFRDYAQTGVPHVILMDPIDRETFVYSSGDLARRDLTGFDVPERGFLPFDSRELLAQLDQK
jgi:Uma2 family endonuclease